MAGTWTSERLPQIETAIRRLTKQHRELKDETLHLALAYAPRRNGNGSHNDIFLFEVIDGTAEAFGQDDLFETTFEASPGLKSGLEHPLHLILATPSELKKALAHEWPLAMEIVDAVQRNDYKVIHADSNGKSVIRMIRAAARAPRRQARG
jgi:hypothetical protein